jgi:hypothetical protein
MPQNASSKAFRQTSHCLEVNTDMAVLEELKLEGTGEDLQQKEVNLAYTRDRGGYRPIWAFKPFFNWPTLVAPTGASPVRLNVGHLRSNQYYYCR